MVHVDNLDGTDHAGYLDGVARRPSSLMELESIHSEKFESSTLHPRRSTDEALRNDFLVQPERLEKLSALVRSQSRHAHLREDLEDSLISRLHVVGNEILRGLSVLRPVICVRLVITER